MKQNSTGKTNCEKSRVYIVTRKSTSFLPEPLGQQVLGLGLDEHLPGIQVNAHLGATHAELLAVEARHVEQALQLDRRVRTEVKSMSTKYKITC